MLVSNCCGARFHEPDYPDNDICTECGEHAGAEEEDEPSVEVIEMPEMTDEWREKIRFAKKKKAVDKDIHNHPLGAGFAHKDHKDNG